MTPLDVNTYVFNNVTGEIVGGPIGGAIKLQSQKSRLGDTIFKSQSVQSDHELNPLHAHPHSSLSETTTGVYPTYVSFYLTDSCTAIVATNKQLPRIMS